MGAASVSLLFAALAVAAMGLTRTAAGEGALGLSELRTTSVPSGPFPKTLVNPSGRPQTLEKPPRRIVSVVLAADEILSALVTPERLVAVSRFADNPLVSTCADRVPRSAKRIRGLDPEGIVALEPDMIFAAGYTLESAVRILVATGTPVVRFGAYNSFADIEANVRSAGAAVGAEQRAQAQIDDMRRRLRNVRARVGDLPRPRVLYYSPGGYTTGSGTLVDEKIHRAGGRNVVSEQGLSGPRHLSLDLLVALDPEVIVLPLWAPDARAEVAALVASPQWRHVQAARSGRVYGIDAKWLTSVSPDGVRGVEELARVFHPEAFDT